MFTVNVTRSTPPVGVLLGGSGRARNIAAPTRPLAALLMPSHLASREVCVCKENRAAEVGPC